MKRMGGLLLACAMVLACVQPACADTLAQRIAAPERAERTSASAGGKTQVVIDAAVRVPDAGRIPVYEVRPRKFSTQEIRAMADAVFGAEPFDGDRDFRTEHIQVGKYSTFDHWNIRMLLSAARRIPTGRSDQPMPAAELLVHMTELPGGGLQDARAQYDVQQVIGEGFYFANLLAWPLDRQPRGTALSFEEARKLADAAVAAFAPGRTLAGAGILSDEIIVSGPDGKSMSGREGYALYYTLALELPITHAEQRISQGDFLAITQSERITVVVDDRGIRSLWFEWPHEMCGVLQEDVHLLDFPQIMEVAARLLPLKYASYERYYKSIRVQVSDIRLGYMRVPVRDTPDRWQLVPAWDFFGSAELLESNRGVPVVREDWACNSLLTLNAADGTAIDRAYGY